jgi:shikimate kinase
MRDMQSGQENDNTNNHTDTGRKLHSGNLILVGMMGSGKTTMGRTLAKHLGRVFVDSDEEIQKRTGVTIPHIFDVEGEPGFRARETAVLADLVKRENMVLATGGGAVLEEQNRKLLQQCGIVVYLRTNVHDLWHRTRHDKNRPLLQTGDPYGKLMELYQQRDPLYQQVADIVIQSGKQSVHGLMLHLAGEIENFRKNNG